MINKFITLILNLKPLTQMFLGELNKLSNERLLAQHIQKYVVEKDLLNSKPNPKLLNKYKDLCNEVKP